jgi:hypothetical protein
MSDLQMKCEPATVPQAIRDMEAAVREMQERLFETRIAELHAARVRELIREEFET